MATWLWMIFFLVFGTFMFLVGHYTGKLDAGENKAPSAQAWIKVREIASQMNKEVALYQIDKDHEEEMALIERGTYDNLPFSDPNDLHADEEEPDGN